MLRAKGVLVQADYLRLSPHVVNGHNVEPNWALLQVAPAQKCMRGAHQDFLKQQIHRSKTGAMVQRSLGQDRLRNDRCAVSSAMAYS